MATQVRTDRLIQTCGACPSQWDGITNDGRGVYVRYRWGFLSVRVAKTVDGDAVAGDQLYGEQLGDGFDGVLSEEGLIEVLVRNGLACEAAADVAVTHEQVAELARRTRT